MNKTLISALAIAAIAALSTPTFAAEKHFAPAAPHAAVRAPGRPVAPHPAFAAHRLAPQRADLRGHEIRRDDRFARDEHGRDPRFGRDDHRRDERFGRDDHRRGERPAVGPVAGKAPVSNVVAHQGGSTGRGNKAASAPSGGSAKPTVTPSGATTRQTGATSKPTVSTSASGTTAGSKTASSTTTSTKN